MKSKKRNEKRNKIIISSLVSLKINKLQKNKSTEEKNNMSGINNSIGYTVATAESENNSQVIPSQIINIII